MPPYPRHPPADPRPCLAASCSRGCARHSRYLPSRIDESPGDTTRYQHLHSRNDCRSDIASECSRSGDGGRHLRYLPSRVDEGDTTLHHARCLHSRLNYSRNEECSRSGDSLHEHSRRLYSRIDECPSDFASNSSRDRFDPKWSEVTYRCGHTARLHFDTRDYHASLNRVGLSLKVGQSANETGRSHLYNTNTLSADYVNVGYSFTEISAKISGSVPAPRVDSKRNVNSGRRYSLNFSDICSEMAAPCRRNERRASSWSLSNVNASSSSHTPRAEAHTSARRPYASVIKIQSADNIRKLQKDLNMSAKDNLRPSTSNAHLLEDLNNAICCQPRESKNRFSVQNLDAKPDSNSARSSVVHWTNSVENRVCCPETVLYGAVFGLKCLK